jgi:hypothetical protein
MGNEWVSGRVRLRVRPKDAMLQRPGPGASHVPIRPGFDASPGRRDGSGAVSRIGIIRATLGLGARVARPDRHHKGVLINRVLSAACSMSAFPPIATEQRTCREVRLVPIPDSCGAAKTSILLSDSSRSFRSTALGQPPMRSHSESLESLAHLMIADTIADAVRTGPILRVI